MRLGNKLLKIKANFTEVVQVVVLLQHAHELSGFRFLCQQAEGLPQLGVISV